MTRETRIIIELSDIQGVEFTCPKCGTKVLYPLHQAPDRLAVKCPSCYEPWISQSQGRPQFDPSLSEQITDWINGIRNLQNNKDVLAKLRLHISTIPE